MRKFIILMMVLYAASQMTDANAETRIKIGIIDTGISYEQAKSKYLCKDGLKSMIQFDKGYDFHGHGTNIFGLIAKQINTKTHCIISYKFWRKTTSPAESVKNTHKALKAAIKDKVKILNLSMGGAEHSSQELRLIKRFLSKGGTIYTAAGNEGLNLNINCNYYPACYKKGGLKNHPRFFVVSSNTGNYPNRGSIVDFYIDGTKKGKPVLSGTSQSTAICTGRSVSKYKSYGIYSLEGQCTTTAQ